MSYTAARCLFFVPSSHWGRHVNRDRLKREMEFNEEIEQGVVRRPYSLSLMALPLTQLPPIACFVQHILPQRTSLRRPAGGYNVDISCYTSGIHGETFNNIPQATKKGGGAGASAEEGLLPSNESLRPTAIGTRHTPQRLVVSAAQKKQQHPDVSLFTNLASDPPPPPPLVLLCSAYPAAVAPVRHTHPVPWCPKGQRVQGLGHWGRGR